MTKATATATATASSTRPGRKPPTKAAHRPRLGDDTAGGHDDSCSTATRPTTPSTIAHHAGTGNCLSDQDWEYIDGGTGNDQGKGKDYSIDRSQATAATGNDHSCSTGRGKADDTAAELRTMAARQR